jgi:hypothetical protein
MTLHNLCAGLLPPHEPLQLERMATADQHITLAAAVTAPEEACRNATQLCHEIQVQGFTGSYRVVATYMAPLRRGQPVCQSTPEPPPAPTARPTLTARQLSYLLLRRPSDRTAEEQEPLARVQQHDPIIA